MQYTIIIVEYEDLPLDANNRFYFYAKTTQELIGKSPGLHNHNMGDAYANYQTDHVAALPGESTQPQHTFNSHLAIYDKNFALWYVTFQLSQLAANPGNHVAIYANKLMVFPGVGECIYMYALAEKKCLDIYTSHNNVLHEHAIEQPAKWWRFVAANKSFLVLNYNFLCLFDVLGLKWRVKRIGQRLINDSDLEVAAGKVIVREAAHFGYYLATYDPTEGSFLHHSEDWSDGEYYLFFIDKITFT